jgi:hypothetical protein
MRTDWDGGNTHTRIFHRRDQNMSRAESVNTLAQVRM